MRGCPVSSSGGGVQWALPFFIAVCQVLGFVLVDEPVVGAAGQGEFGDVGATIVLPVGVGVMGLAAAGGLGAVRSGASAVAGEEHQSLTG